MGLKAPDQEFEVPPPKGGGLRGCLFGGLYGGSMVMGKDVGWSKLPPLGGRTGLQEQRPLGRLASESMGCDEVGSMGLKSHVQ